MPQYKLSDDAVKKLPFVKFCLACVVHLVRRELISRSDRITAKQSQKEEKEPAEKTKCPAAV